MDHKDIGRHLAELNNLVHREMLRCEPCAEESDPADKDSVSHAGSCILAYLHDHSETDIFQKDIEKEFHVRRSTVSKVLSALESKGYIKRIEVDSDHRLKKIVLTDKARLITDKLKSARSRLQQKMVRGISDDELTKFLCTMEKIKQNLREGTK